MSKNKKIIIGIIIVLLIIVIGVIVAYKLIENRVTNREDFKFNVENISSELVDTENLDENEYSFFGKVIESNEKCIIVEPNENEEERKSSDKIYIGLGEHNDAIYMVGTNVKITYDGTIMDSYPAQVKASKIEIKLTDNFELIFNPKKDLGIKTIIDKEKTDKYPYNIYSYGGNVKINIDNKEYDLREALLNNKITMEEIIVEANQDEKDGKIKADMYKDGGSIVYHYENYTIIKCHTIEGNRDVYIGTKEMTIKDLIINEQI